MGKCTSDKPIFVVTMNRKLKFKRVCETSKTCTGEEEDAVDGMTEAEIRFMKANNVYKKKEIEKKCELSYREQKEKMAKSLMSEPIHHDMEGD